MAGQAPIQAVDVNGKVLKVTTKTTSKKGQGIVTAKVTGSGLLIMRIDGSKIKGPQGRLADPDGDGIAGGIKELKLGK